ncbi:MAG: hypothetical protein ACEQSR_01525 [Candidatus Methylacidiphilales bacterium]
MKYELTVPREAKNLTEREEIFKFKLTKDLVGRVFKDKTHVLNWTKDCIGFYGHSKEVVSFFGLHGSVKINRVGTNKTIIELKPNTNG